MKKYIAGVLSLFLFLAISICTVKASDSEYNDRENPVLLECFFEPKINGGEMLEVSVRIADESGLEKVDIVFYNSSLEQYLFLYQSEIIYDDAKGVYTVSYKIPRYQDAGTYRLDAVGLTDSSEQKNYVNYWVQNNKLINLDGQVSALDKRNEKLEIVLDNEKNVVNIFADELYDTVYDAKKNDTVVLTGGDSDESQWIMGLNSLKLAKEKSLTLVLPDIFTDTEMVIDASKLPENLAKETYAGYVISEFKDNQYDLQINMTNSEIPFSLRFKEDAIKKLEGVVFRLDAVDENGESSIIKDDLAIDKTGYINLDFPDGINSGDGWSHYKLVKTGQQKEKVKIGTVKLSSTQYLYSGKVRKPSVTVKDKNGHTLEKGTDYKVSYSSGRKNVGIYRVTVKGTGEYTGSVTKLFIIVPKAVKTLNAANVKNKKQIKLSWTASTGATGYRVYSKKSGASKYTYQGSTTKRSYTVSGLKENTKYRFKVIPYYKEKVGMIKYYSPDAYKTVLIRTKKKGK